MSNYHVLTTSEPDHEIKVVFHIPLADTNNSAGVSYRTALQQSGLNPGRPQSSVPWLTTEQADLDSCALVERQETIYVNAYLSNSEKRDILDARYTALTSIVPTKIQALLKWWGTDRDVP